MEEREIRCSSRTSQQEEEEVCILFTFLTRSLFIINIINFLFSGSSIPNFTTTTTTTNN